MEKEAQHLKEEAEIKFKARDFARALWLANLAGIQQYIAAYKVHVAAYKSTITTAFACKTNENTTNFTTVRVPDWYKVLEISDDDSFDVSIYTMNEHYKRMELLVHPDKNDSVAAEGAFKLVQDGLDVLSDPDMRKGFEIERNRSRAQLTSSGSTSSKQRNTKASSFYYDDQEETEDTWLFGEEEDAEEDLESETRSCPTCSYPCYVQTCKKECSSSVYCRNCDRIFIFS
ncbi:hypothetical protein MKW98_005793 [Papaver atlanticum]|uniref:J domain-containing protein n=1 Tax=Papaver atlanticum TaxID=357466 RepID=A0AAD4TIK1_9MAGN|nr:hypothetical protein MKW98_005793 [Papaver atlanticum]